MRRMFKGAFSVLLIISISQLVSCEKKTTTTEAFDTSECFSCHTGTSEVGKKVLWAWDS